MMKTEVTAYEAPTMHVITVQVEQGFALSGGNEPSNFESMIPHNM